MTGTINFTDSVIRNIQVKDKRQLFWCNGCPCFGIRVTPSGVKTFVFKYMANPTGNKRISRWITIGKYPEWSIRRARSEYDRLYEQVQQYGRDLVAERSIEKAKQEKYVTVTDFIDIYLDHARLKGKTSMAEEQRVFNLDVVSTIGDKSICDVDFHDIEAIQSRILERAQHSANASRNGKVAVKNTLAYVRQLFNLAIKKGIIDSNPVSKIESLGVSGSRNRILSFEEIWTFWNKIEQLGIPPVTSKALKFLLVTMQRSIEVRNMRYRSLKSDENIWEMEVEETKNRSMHRVPLNQYAIDLLAEVYPYTRRSNYIFGATRAMSPPRKPLDNLVPLGKSAMAQAIRRNRDDLSIDDFCPHDLRRTGATWITAVGLPKLYARLMLNHSDGDRDVTGEVYVQYSYDFEKQRAVKVWEFILDQIVTCESPDLIPTLDVMRERVKLSGLL